MSLSGLVRLGSLCAVVGAVLLVISDLWGLLMGGLGGGQPFSETATTTSFAFTGLLSLLAAVLILFGLVGLHLRQAERAGVVGLLGFLIAFLGTALVVGVTWTLFFVLPSVAMEAPEFVDAEGVPGRMDMGFILSFSVLAVGWALFGVGALMALWLPTLGSHSAHSRCADPVFALPRHWACFRCGGGLGGLLLFGCREDGGRAALAGALNFRERLPSRTLVNKGKKRKGRGCYTSALLRTLA